MSNLVIVESPAKAKTIAKYLNANKALASYGTFMVVSSMGHIRDLKKKELGIDIENGFQPMYQVNEDKLATVKELRDKANEANLVWLASDYDREGEAIAMHLKEVLRLKKYRRITFTEITPKALEHAILHPREIDQDLVDAQETRRILDRLVGFQLSPLLWKAFTTSHGTGLSAGRVQSAVLHLLVDKEREIASFQDKCYWHYVGDFLLQLQGEKHTLQDVHVFEDGAMVKEPEYKKAHQFMQGLSFQCTIHHVVQKESKKTPDLPFITSTLQQEAYNKLGFALKHTMHVAQELYEKGYITYMRTDSYHISEEFRSKAIMYIRQTYGPSYDGQGVVYRKKKSKNAQEAHEAIRPTQVDTTSATLPLGGDHKRLYDLIWKRTVASMMTPCILEELVLHIRDKSFGPSMYFMTTFSKVKFNGFMILYDAKNETNDFATYVQAIQKENYQLKCARVTARNTWSAPPARYNDSSIIRTLEKEGIGRPSTYAGIMSKLFEKSYLTKTDIQGEPREARHLVSEKGKIHQVTETVQVGAERTRIVPTNIGKEVDAFLTTHFAYIVDKTFTANMEADLDLIASADKSRERVLRAFWNSFSKDVQKVAGSVRNHAKKELQTESKQVTVRGHTYTVRLARYGPVIEYMDQGEKKYINLKPFLQLVRKELLDIDERDIDVLTSTPVFLGTLEGKKVYLAYGPYGFYAKLETQNVKLPSRAILQFLDTRSLPMKEVQTAVEYKETRARQAPSNGSSKKVVAKKTIKRL